MTADGNLLFIYDWYNAPFSSLSLMNLVPDEINLINEMNRLPVCFAAGYLCDPGLFSLHQLSVKQIQPSTGTSDLISGQSLMEC